MLRIYIDAYGRTHGTVLKMGDSGVWQLAKYFGICSNIEISQLEYPEPLLDGILLGIDLPAG